MDLTSGKFSVVIPTPQRSRHLGPLVAQCAEHNLVHEVLVINNAATPLKWDSEKVHVLHQKENIFVNPGWNLGAATARGEYLAIVNDDVRFRDEALDHAAKILRRGWYSMVGPSRHCFNGAQQGRIGHRFASLHTSPFGTFMCLRRENYVPIPDDLLIWGGDDWLMLNQRRPLAELINTTFETEMSTTSGSSEFQYLRRSDFSNAVRLLKPIRRKKLWHWPASALLRLRLFRECLEASNS